MSVTTKLILRTDKLLNNLKNPILLRITINRQSQFVTTKKSATPVTWDQNAQNVTRFHPDYKTISPLLRNIISTVDLYLLNAGANNTVVSFDDVKKIVLKLTNNQREISAGSLFSYFEHEIERLKNEERLGYAATYR